MELYKIYHRNYNNIYELYNDLQDAINDIEIENNIIKIKYRNDTFKIKFIHYGYITYLNDKKEKGVSEDQDIYYFALEFAHDNLKFGNCEIYDYNVTKIEEFGISYIDSYNRDHFIDFNKCCKNWSQLNQNNINYCVGERNIYNNSYLFYTDHVKTKLIFSNSVSTNIKKQLFGSRKKRFFQLQMLLTNFGFIISDL